MGREGLGAQAKVNEKLKTTCQKPWTCRETYEGLLGTPRGWQQTNSNSAVCLNNIFNGKWHILATRHKITSRTLSPYNINASFQLPLRWWPCFSWSPWLKKKTRDKESTEELFFELFAITAFSGLRIFSGFAIVIAMALHTDSKHHGHKLTCTTDKTDTISEERLSQMQNWL